ncbi:YcjF family protein [Aestuariibacter salexigens]|uniref:YcjF family protein n=1 Tax=Aestuariibacter salexigens TaxID=226010 RepID=UPI00040BE425|nr:YcjF family protein [Aestuariibacter salexigens]
MSAERPTPLRSKVSQRTLEQSQPKVDLPVRVERLEWQADGSASRLSLGSIALMSGALCVLGFALFDAMQSIIVNFSAYPVATSLLGALLSVFTLTLSVLTFREWQGFTNISQYTQSRLQEDVLAEMDKAPLLTALRDHARHFSKHSYAAQCFTRFEQSLQDDHSAAEVRKLYKHCVTDAVEKKAQEVLKKESVAAGSMTFISPNHLIQTLVIVWISLRTIRRVSLVFGLRPGRLGNWKLLKVLAQNLAAQSIFDLATDEVTNQISGSLSAKFMENSAEAVAAGALNVRLGKTLIRLLR